MVSSYPRAHPRRPLVALGCPCLPCPRPTTHSSPSTQSPSLSSPPTSTSTFLSNHPPPSFFDRRRIISPPPIASSLSTSTHNPSHLLAPASPPRRSPACFSVPSLFVFSSPARPPASLNFNQAHKPNQSAVGSRKKIRAYQTQRLPFPHCPHNPQCPFLLPLP